MKNKQEELELFNERYESHIRTVGDNIPNITGEDLNDYWEEGAYQGNNLINAPTNEHLKIVIIKHSEDWIVQQALTPAQVMWLRAKRGKGTLDDITDWKEVDFGDGSEQGKVEVTIIEKPASHPLASRHGHGYMSKDNWIKLDGIDEDANNYMHPEYHSPDIIAQDELNRFVTDVEKEGWNDKSDVDHNHDEAYSSINHKHQSYEDSINIIVEELNIQRAAIKVIQDYLDQLESTDVNATVNALMQRVQDLERTIADHTNDMI